MGLGKAISGAVGGAAKALGKAVVEHPVATLGVGGLGAADIALQAAILPIQRGVKQSQYQKPENLIDEMVLQQKLDLATRRVEADRQRKRRFLQELELKRPDIYYSTLAGRRLAPGTVIIGGDPNSPALDQLATMVAEGQIR